ncbi:MAG: hypothetical protein JSR45_06655 [Proteobacteria bacterium]|nr:hypothetical protein [Pseudomonadota bacterium]
MSIVRHGLALALVVGLGAAGGANAAPAAGDEVSFRINSWGKLLEAWTIRPDGSGEYQATKQGPTKDFYDVVLVTKRLAPAPGRYAQLQAALKPAERYDGKGPPCQKQIYDLPYGQISWVRSGATHGFSFDLGCGSADANVAYKALENASAVVTAWAKDAPVAEEKPLNPK